MRYINFFFPSFHRVSWAMKRRRVEPSADNAKKALKDMRSAKNSSDTRENTTIDDHTKQDQINNLIVALFATISSYDVDKINEYSRRCFSEDIFLIIVQLGPTELYQVNQYKEIRGRESVSSYFMSSQRSIPDGLRFHKLIDAVSGSTDCFITNESTLPRRNTILINTTMSAKGTKTYEIVETFHGASVETPLESKMAVLSAAETLQLLSNNSTADTSAYEDDSSDDELSPSPIIDSLMLLSAIQRFLTPDTTAHISVKSIASANTLQQDGNKIEEASVNTPPLRIIERCPIFVSAPSAIFISGDALPTPRPFKIHGHVEVYVDPLNFMIFGLRYVLKSG